MANFLVYVCGPNQQQAVDTAKPISVVADKYKPDRRQFGADAQMREYFIFWNGADINTGYVADFPREVVIGIVKQP